MQKRLLILFIVLGFIASFVSCDIDDIGASDQLDNQTEAEFEVAALMVVPPVQSVDPNHPGSSIYPYTSLKITDITLPDNRKYMRVIEPNGVTAKLPVVFWAGGKMMEAASFNQKMLEHIAKKGMIAVNMQVQGGFFDTDFVKFGRWYNNGVKIILSKIANADPNNIYFAGHSLGAQVSIIAAGLATGEDTTNQFVDPKGLILHAFDNSCGPNCSGDLNNPAKGYAVKVAATVQATILEYADDTIAGPSKTYAQNLYAKLQSVKKQWVLVKGKAFGTDYGLDANHQTAVCAGSAPMGLGGRVYLNSLDWHMVWKFTTGVPMAISNPASPAVPYVFGTENINGGNAANGVVLIHELKAQTF